MTRPLAARPPVTVLAGIGVLATCPPDAPAQDEIGLVADAALAWDATGDVLWAGPESEVPAEFAGATRVSAEGALVVGRGATVGTADVMATASGRTVVLAAGARVYGTVWAAEHGVVAG